VSLEEEIAQWSASRSPWQRAVLLRVARGETLSEQDCDDIVDKLLVSEVVGDSTFGLAQMPNVKPGDPRVSLVSIANPEHLNALASDAPLTFEATGLTIVYGDNASGKSGYARLLKRIAKAREREEILSDVFRDTALAMPKAALAVRIGEVETNINWPDENPSELQRMLFYDQACGSAYITAESDFPYRPAALFVMDGLIKACGSIRGRIDVRLDNNTRRARSLPTIDPEIGGTALGKFLATLSGRSSGDELDLLLAPQESATDTVESLRAEEARLNASDAAVEKQRLLRKAEKLDVLKTHCENIAKELSDGTIDSLRMDRSQLKALEDAAFLVTNALESEPVEGVGSSAWKELWESARRFSQSEAYRTATFPVVNEEAKCLLCHQPLVEDARERFRRFERYVQDDTQRRLREARAGWNVRIAGLGSMGVRPDAIEAHLTDLAPDESALVSEARTLMEGFDALHASLVTALASAADLPRPSVSGAETCSRLGAAAMRARETAAAFSDPALTRQRLGAVVARRKELELLAQMREKREDVAGEIQRLSERQALEDLKNEAATGPITKKIADLSEHNITEVIRDTFTRETDRLSLERVTIAKTRADKGALLHLPKLVGARQDAGLRRVFSEGERTALGLAAFFTEAYLDASKSALILDDPVTSLDHVRRAKVAARLAALAKERQVIIFTHDVSFVADLRREAGGEGVLLTERSVTRGRGSERKPGTCTNVLPWKARDAAARLGHLRTELARIKRDSDGWDTDGYEREVALWAGDLSETWERIFSQEIVGPILADGGMEVRPNMTKVLAKFSQTDAREFQASYSRISQWAKRHDKSAMTNYVAPVIDTLEQELATVDSWHKRVKTYRN
jgi:energy-coupling factor transporter ATP-binding protein EcfA2